MIAYKYMPAIQPIFFNILIALHTFTRFIQTALCCYAAFISQPDRIMFVIQDMNEKNTLMFTLG